MRRRQGGYALIVVLGSLMLLALVAQSLDTRIERWRAAQQGWADWLARETRLDSARDEVLALMLAHGLTPRGFGPMRVDGRSYRLPSGLLFSIQDARGLLPMADLQRPELLRCWLQRRGLAADEAESLLDALADYTDADALRRPLGAEQADYAAAGLAPPRNDWLMSPYELRRVHGWASRPQLWQRASDWAQTTREPWLNPNTASPELLVCLPGVGANQITQILSLRERQHIDSAATLASLTGVLLPDDPAAFYPGLVYRIRLWSQEGGRAIEYTVMLTLEAPAQPWAVLDVRQLPPQPPDPKPALPAPPLPGRAELPT